MPSNWRSPRARLCACSRRKLVVPRQLGDLVEGRGVCPAVVLDAGEGGEREDVVGQQVAATKFDRVDAQLDRGLVDDSLEQRRGLRSAGAAVGAHRGGVRCGDDDVELDAGELVGAVRHPPCATGQERADAGVRAAVADQPDSQSGERAVAFASELDELDLSAAVRQGEHVFAARRGPHDRPAKAPGRGGNHDLLGVHTRFAAEAAPDEGCDNSDVGRRHAERG